MNLKMIMKELMHQRKIQMKKTILSLTPGIFFHQALLKAMGPTSGRHHFHLMTTIFMHLKLMIVMRALLYLPELTSLL